MTQLKIESGGVSISGTTEDPFTHNPNWHGYNQFIGGDGNFIVNTVGSEHRQVWVQLGNGTHDITLGSGNDDIFLGTGHSIVDLGTGDDFLLSQGPTYAYASSGDKIMFLDGANSVGVGGTGNDTILVGQAGVAMPGGGNNIVYLSPSATEISAKGAHDHIYADQFITGSADGLYTLKGFHVGDTIDLTSLGYLIPMNMTVNNLQMQGNTLNVNFTDLNGVDHHLAFAGAGSVIRLEGGIPNAVADGTVILAQSDVLSGGEG